MSERPLKRSAGTRGHRSAPLILAAGERLLDGEHSDPSERCPTSPRALPASASSQPQSLSPREQMLVQAMDRLAGIDIRRTFDLDGSGFVSAAVLRRSLSAFDPQVFNAHCLQLLLGPAQADSVRIQDVFGPFWQPFCHRVQLLEEKLAQTRRMSQKRQVELAQTAQDTADALRLAQRELAQLQPHNSCPSADTQDDARSILELRERLAHSEQQRKKMEEQLRKMSRAERQVPQKSLALKGAEEEGCKGRRKRGTPHWHEEAADSMDVQKLLSSEQTRKALEQDLRHALAKLDEAERDKQQLQRSLQALQASKPGSDAEGRANSARNDLLQHGADQELKRLELALAAQSEACRRQEQQLRELSAQKEELAAELKRQPDNSAEDLQAKLRKMEDEVIQVREVMATREREAVEAVHHAVCRTKAELEEPLRSSIEHLETKADAAFDRVTRAEAESQDLADCMRQISGELAKLHLDLDGSQQALAESNRRAGEATAAAAAAVAESDARLSKAQSQQKESENRLEFLSGEIIKLKLENATLQKNLAQQSAEISRLEQEGRGFQQEAARSSKQAEALRAELASQIAQLQTVQRESKDLARELELRSLPERRFEALDGEVQRLDGRLQQMTLQFLSSATSDDLSRVASRLAQTELQVPETHTTELHQLQKELGTVTGELGASRARLEAAVAEKQVLEARLAEALQDVEEARKQREEKGWEAAEAAASANREMARQRSESDEKYRLLEKEHSSVRDKLQSALSELAQAESQKKVLELQVETKCQQLKDLEERQAQAEKLTVLIDQDVKAARSFGSHSGSAHEVDPALEQQRLGQVQTELAQIMQQFQKVVLELKSLQSHVQEEKEATAAAESGFQESRSEIEATALACSALKQQLVAISDHFAKQRIEADAAQRGANKLETRVTAADGRRLEATFVPYSADVGSEEVLHASEHEDGRQRCQLQKELGTVTGELGASRARLEAAVAEKQVLEARLAEALQDVEEARKQREEKGWEAAEAAASANREMARQRSESDEKYRLLEKEHSSLRDKLQSALSELAQAESQKKVLELQVETKCQQLTDLEERQERELAAQAEKLEQTQVEVDRLTTELSKASQGSPAEEFKSVAEELRPRSESENDGSEKDRKIQELQAQLDEVSQQLNQVQAELEQRSIEAAEALVDIGQDVDAIEWESGQRGRKLEAQIAEITEMEKDAEETVEALSEELDRCNAKLAASENKRRELEYHLEDTSAKLTSVQDELAQCQIDTAQALTAASDDLALLKAESEAEIRRLRALLEDSDGSDLLSPQHLLLPSQEGLSPKSGTGSVQSSAGNSVWT